MCDETRARRLARGVACCVRLRTPAGATVMSAAESSAHTRPQGPRRAVLHCEGRVRSSVRDEDVHVDVMLRNSPCGRVIVRGH